MTQKKLHAPVWHSYIKIDACAASQHKMILPWPNNNNVLVPGIVPRSDKRNARAIEVNRHLKNECRKTNICFISNLNINPKYDCNKSGLHLHCKGTNKLAENFLFALSKFDKWHKAPLSSTNFCKNKLRKCDSQQRIRKKDSSVEAFVNLRSMKRKKKHLSII